MRGNEELGCKGFRKPSSDVTMILFQYSNLLLFAIGDFDFSITAGETNNIEICGIH